MHGMALRFRTTGHVSRDRAADPGIVVTGRENLSLDLVPALSTCHKMARSPRLPRSLLLSGVRNRQREGKLQLNFSIDLEQSAEDNIPKLKGS